jgi:hypothetical protein
MFEHEIEQALREAEAESRPQLENDLLALAAKLAQARTVLRRYYFLDDPDRERSAAELLLEWREQDREPAVDLRRQLLEQGRREGANHYFSNACRHSRCELCDQRCPFDGEPCRCLCHARPVSESERQTEEQKQQEAA